MTFADYDSYVSGANDPMIMSYDVNQRTTGGAAPLDPAPMDTKVGMAAMSGAAPGGFMQKPTHWWISLVLVLAGLIFVSRRFGGDQKFGNIRLTLWNGVLLVIFYVIILNFLKVVFGRYKVPGLSELVLAA